MMKDICVELEHYETPQWAIDAILKAEKLHRVVVDPCCGAGVMSDAAKNLGYEVYSTDIHDWGYRMAKEPVDFLKFTPKMCEEFTVFMNPPFSKAVEFVEKSIDLGAQKIIAFQRFSWWESRRRREFWQKNPPTKVYICGDRAHCWRHDIPLSERGSSTPTAHAWFVWDFDRPQGQTQLCHVWRD